MLLSSASLPRIAIATLAVLGFFLILSSLTHTTSPVPAVSSILLNHQRPNAPTRARVGKVSVAANKLDGSDMIDRALLSHQTQNDLHGYPQFTATHEAVGEWNKMRKKHPSGAWTKPAYLLSVVVDELEKPYDERLDWLYWFDADTVIMNPQTRLETFLPPKDDKNFNDLHMLVASNWDGINSGAFALRVHPWTVSMLSAVLAYPMYKSDRVEKDRFRDQSAFHWVLEEKDSPLAQSSTGGKEHWTFVPMRWFNSLPFNNAFDKSGKWLVGKEMKGGLFDNGTTEVYDDGKGGKVQPWKVMQGDMLVHFAGCSAGGKRDSWMGPWLERAEAVLPEWSNSTTQIALQPEIDEFWRTEAQRLGKLREASEADEKKAR